MTLPSLYIVAEDAKYSQTFNENESQPESFLKPGNKPEDSVNGCGATRTPSPDSDSLSRDESSHARLNSNLYHLTVQSSRRRYASRSPAPPPRTVLGRLQLFWVKNKGLAQVLMAQFFGTLMNVTTRLLEMEGNDGEQYRQSPAWFQTDIAFRQGLSSFPDSVR
jgi:hypothetical protein